MRITAILAAVAALVLAAGGIAFALWPSGVHMIPAPTAPSVRNAGYCVEDREHGHWTHFIAGKNAPNRFEPGPCPVSTGAP